MTFPVVFLLFVGSGAAALMYEIVWFQLLELVIGSSSVSIGVLLGTFMGGMCLGSLLLPRFVPAKRHPFRVYAALEIVIAVCGVLLLFVMPHVGRLYTAWGGDGLTGFLLRGAVAAVCLLPPTMAMGATLPAVSRSIDTTPEGVSWLGFFYAGNIAGAVMGSLLAGFYLLRVHDAAVATYVAVGLNIVVAAVALLLASRTEVVPSVEQGPYPFFGVSAPIYIAIALSGFCALVGEVIWTRLLAILFGATVYTFSIILAVFLVGLGIGSTIGASLSRSVNPRIAFGWCQFLLVAAIAWTAHEIGVSLPIWPINPAMSPDIWLMFKLDIVRTLWAVLPPAILWGMSFPLALASLASEGQDPGRLVGGVYAANTVGGVVGALSASLLLVAWIGSQHAQQVMTVVSAIAGVLVLFSVFRRSSTPAAQDSPASAKATAVRRSFSEGGSPALHVFAIVVALVATVWLTRGVPPINPMLVAHGRFAATLLGQAGEIIYVGEGLQSSVAVSRLPNGQLAYHNAGKIQASSAPEDMRLQRMLGHLTTLVPAHPRSVLVIGCGAGVTAGAVSVNPDVERVTIAEIEPLVPRVVSTYFGPQNHDVVKNPKVHIHIDDARHFLLTTKETFDAITSDPLDPWVKGAATLYTQEFFEAARAHLNPGGVVTLFVQLYDSNPEAIRSEIATFFSVFPDGIIAGNTFRGVGYDTVLLGQREPLHIDLDAIQARLAQPRYEPVLHSLREIGLTSSVDLFATYAGRARDLGPYMAAAAINRDADLRLQDLAGLGLNTNESDTVYAEILKHRRFPDELFSGSEASVKALRDRIEPAR